MDKNNLVSSIQPFNDLTIRDFCDNYQNENSDYLKFIACLNALFGIKDTNELDIIGGLLYKLAQARAIKKIQDGIAQHKLKKEIFNDCYKVFIEIGNLYKRG